MYKACSISLELENQQTSMNPDGSLTICIPITFKRTGGKKLIMSTSEANFSTQYESPKEHEPLINAVIKAFMWKEQIENGEFSSMRDIANKMKVNESYVCRIFRLTLLAPDIIEAIINGKQPKGLTLASVMRPFPVVWEEQRIKFGFKNHGL